VSNFVGNFVGNFVCNFVSSFVSNFVKFAENGANEAGRFQPKILSQHPGMGTKPLEGASHARFAAGIGGTNRSSVFQKCFRFMQIC